ncbi:MAG: hypothetical protein C0478_16615 [Planctomyces sp.]|nr:hypothetical protein [Planctomyces sp.]
MSSLFSSHTASDQTGSSLDERQGDEFSRSPKKPRERRRRNSTALNSVDLDITPMIDCVFLLLIFFMVSSTMQGRADLDVPFAVHTVGVESRQATVFILRTGRDSSSGPTITVEETRETIPLSQVAQQVENAVRDGRREVVVKAEGEVAHGDVRDVMQAASRVEGVTVYAGVREK